MLNASTNPVCVLFYYILCTYISYTILYYTTYAIYYIYIVVDYTKGWFIAAAESHNKDPNRWRLLFVGSQGTEGRGWATQRTQQVTESRKRDDPAHCIIIAVALHGQMYKILQAHASSLMAAT